MVGADQQPGLLVEGLTYGYGTEVVLDQLDLELPLGLSAAVLGRNGAGKSTLLNLISGVYRPHAGSIHFGGTDFRAIAPRERARLVAMTPQVLQIAPTFTLRDCVSLGRTPYLHPLRGETAHDRSEVDRAMADAGVERLANRRIGELSGGERQLAALAMSLAQQPQLLLLDEATAHLDLNHQLALLQRVRALQKERGLTVLAALHDPNLAGLFFDRVVLLGDRKILRSGPPTEVLTQPTLEQLYGAELAVIPHPRHGSPVVVLDPRS